MKNLLRAGALALAMLFCAPLMAGTQLPQCLNAGNASVPCQGAMPVDQYGFALFTPLNPGYVTFSLSGLGSSSNNPLFASLTSLPAGEQIIGHSLGISALASGSFTRPANTTAYASGQFVSTSTTAGAATPITLTGASRVAGVAGASPSTVGSTGTITGLRLSKSSASITNASFRVHLFRTLPTLTGADGATLAGTVNGIAAVHIGYVDVTMDQAFTDGAKGEAAPARGPIIFTTAGSTSLYAVIEARGAYTPTSGETFTVTAEIVQD